MTAASPNALARTLRRFFAEHLPGVRGVSPHTVQSYRYAFTLFLRFLADRTAQSVVALDLGDLTPAAVIAFLDHLEDVRRNRVATRNTRLAALHAFARFVATQDPEWVAPAQQILAVPFKRATLPTVDYLEAPEIHAMLEATDTGTPAGRRDHTLLLTLFNTGARVQELLDLRPVDLSLTRPAHVRLRGKGQKERVCPLWPHTADDLRQLLTETSLDETSTSRVFRNRPRAGGIIGDTVDWLKRDFGVDHLADWALGRLLKDLAFYYSNREIENREKPPVLAPARGLLRNEVSSALKEAHAAGKEILLIAHSMGAIISYDALRGMGRERGQKVEIPNFVTIGAPLGLPHVKHKILEEWEKRRGFTGGDPQIRTPSVVTKDWTNYSDRKDPVAADIHLADDYAANEARVQVRDDLVLNDYHTVEDGKRKENHHKSYGYLRTPEMAEYVRAFLEL